MPCRAVPVRLDFPMHRSSTNRIIRSGPTGNTYGWMLQRGVSGVINVTKSIFQRRPTQRRRLLDPPSSAPALTLRRCFSASRGLRLRSRSRSRSLGGGLAARCRRGLRSPRAGGEARSRRVRGGLALGVSRRATRLAGGGLSLSARLPSRLGLRCRRRSRESRPSGSTLSGLERRLRSRPLPRSPWRSRRLPLPLSSWLPFCRGGGGGRARSGGGGSASPCRPDGRGGSGGSFFSAASPSESLRVHINMQ